MNAANAVKMAIKRRMAVSLTPRRWLSAQSSSPQAIPDNDSQGLTAAVQIAEAAAVQDISVTIDIDHGYLGDLEISIVAPSGEAVLLQGRTLGVKKKLQTTYSMTTTPALQLLLGVGTQGQWQLQVVDAIAGDTGTLKSWQLKLGA